MTTWHGMDVVVLNATIGGLPVHEKSANARYLDEDIVVHISFLVEGPAAENDPPWGPQRETTVPLAELTGPVSYCHGRDRLTVTLR